MIASLDPHPVIATRKTPNLILHCGAQNVEMDEVRKVRTPRSTNSWCPIPHHQLISQVQNTLKTTNLRIGTQAHSLSHEGQRYFGLMEIHAQKSNNDYCWVLGLRNSHDKTFPAGIVAGASVFVCDNLSFSGEIKFARKHTRFIVRDLPQLVSRSIGLLLSKWHDQDKRIAAYKEADTCYNVSTKRNHIDLDSCSGLIQSRTHALSPQIPHNRSHSLRWVHHEKLQVSGSDHDYGPWKICSTNKLRMIGEAYVSPLRLVS